MTLTKRVVGFQGSNLGSSRPLTLSNNNNIINNNNNNMMGNPARANTNNGVASAWPASGFLTPPSSPQSGRHVSSLSSSQSDRRLSHLASPQSSRHSHSLPSSQSDRQLDRPSSLQSSRSLSPLSSPQSSRLISPLSPRITRPTSGIKRLIQGGIIAANRQAVRNEAAVTSQPTNSRPSTPDGPRRLPVAARRTRPESPALPGRPATADAGTSRPPGLPNGLPPTGQVMPLRSRPVASSQQRGRGPDGLPSYQEATRNPGAYPQVRDGMPSYDPAAHGLPSYKEATSSR
ncbi:hypothetical protein CDD81_6952 [Ophiocordyceps australis]|uniref:Uncharacterized protein n=1 Tax=Ophiocordyceps australis TaxID=1399860 RepID=A0A2C5YCN5_9HYPO|nr:hypothetical protein CDD81_6952 [Ophiocordyceps australis]